MLLEIQIQICKLHGLGTLGPRNITVITSYDYSLLHIITVPEVLHDVITVIFPFTNQTQSQLHFATGPAASAAWGYCRERRSQRSRSLRTRPLWGPATWTTWNGKILEHQICQCLFNLSCFICHSQNCTNCTWSWISCSCSSQSPHLTMGALTIPVCWKQSRPSMISWYFLCFLHWSLEVVIGYCTQLKTCPVPLPASVKAVECTAISLPCRNADLMHCYPFLPLWESLAKLEKQHRQNVNSWSAKTKEGKTVWVLLDL